MHGRHSKRQLVQQMFYCQGETCTQHNVGDVVATECVPRRCRRGASPPWVLRLQRPECFVTRGGVKAFITRPAPRLFFHPPKHRRDRVARFFRACPSNAHYQLHCRGRRLGSCNIFRGPKGVENPTSQLIAQLQLANNSSKKPLRLFAMS